MFLIKLMHNFTMHSNEMACRKSWRLGLDQVYYHMSGQQNNLPHLLFINQISTIPIDTPQTCNLCYHLKYQWWSLYKLHHIHQLTLPVEIPPHSHQNKHQINLLKLSLQNKGSQIYHQHSLWLLLLIHVL